MSTATLAVTEAFNPREAPRPVRKGSAFWLTFLAIVVSVFLSALDLTAVGTALPTITSELNGGADFAWVGTAYALSSTAFMPLSGTLADIFGRKPIILLAILLFAIGSAFAGAAQSMHWLIAARTIEGVGGGAIINLADIVVSDLVPLAERGLYQGLVALTWAFACGIGPPIGGSLSQNASWRWLFYINLPLTGIAFFLVLFFLKVRTPEGTFQSKLMRVDWFGNFIVISGTTLAVVGLTFGGSRFAWDSVQVLVPLILGFLLIGVFLFYEGKVPKEPTIPWEVLNNRTTIGGYIGTFVHGIASISIIYYMPVFFQAVLGASPIGSGVDVLVSALFIAAFALVSGVAIQVSQKYVYTNVIGWILTTVGFGVVSLMRDGDSKAQWVGYQIICAAGIGLLFPAPMFAVMAPLPVERNAAALAFFAFTRSFAQTWGITVASTILQNELQKKLPASFVSLLPGGSNIAYASIPLIQGLPEPLRTQVRVAFADSMSIIWKTMIGICGAGILSLFLLKEIPMNTAMDDKYGLHSSEKADGLVGMNALGEPNVDHASKTGQDSIC